MHIFENIDDATKRLAIHSKKFKIPIRPHLQSEIDIVKNSVGQNIFRALGLENHKPSEIYRKWAYMNFKRLHKQLKNSDTELKYSRVIETYTDSFLNSWTKECNDKLVYGPASKIVNLLIKTIQESSIFRIESIIPFQHIPWDSYTLRPLRNIIDELSNSKFRINIPTSATMSYVTTYELYDILQKSIFSLYHKIPKNPPAIYFDYFAWNDNH